MVNAERFFVYLLFVICSLTGCTTQEQSTRLPYIDIPITPVPTEIIPTPLPTIKLSPTSTAEITTKQYLSAAPNVQPKLTSTAFPITATPTISITELIPQETDVLAIPLTSDASSSYAEISGMAWYKNWLMLLPQYPNFGGHKDGRIFALAQDDIIRFVNGEIEGPLQPIEIPFLAPGLSKKISGFEGYEAILFDEETAYLTIEASPVSGMTGYIVKGSIAPNLSALAIDTDQVVEIKSATGLSNKSDETILLVDQHILTIHEANGIKVNPNPAAKIFDLDLMERGELPLQPIEYRITDATSVDENGRFWAINYFYPGEPELFNEFDPISAAYGKGKSHKLSEGVERLVEFEIQKDQIVIVDQPPIQLRLLPDELRNWEGIARLGDMGLLIVTDKFPETILGFVPFP